MPATPRQPQPHPPAQPRPLILASASPRRAALLSERGYEFTVGAAAWDEPPPDTLGIGPARTAEVLAWLKARSVADRHPGAHVLGADTVVVLGGRIIGKPVDEPDARRILGALSGSAHQVITGVALIHADVASCRIGHGVTDLSMNEMTAADIDHYIASGEWRGKAGAYAIQETADRFVSVRRGSWSNVVGLPMELVEAWFRSGNK
jgi:septum formation protein